MAKNTWIVFVILGVIFLPLICGIFAYIDISPAKGEAVGYISYQERGGLFQTNRVCWRDTITSECEIFDPDGKTYSPGKYNMNYECSRFKWAWEASSECKILNATKIGDI